MKEGLNKIEKVSVITKMATKRQNADSDFLFKASFDNTSFWNNYLVSDFAIAAQDILGLKKYKGNRSEINNLIASKLAFE